MELVHGVQYNIDKTTNLSTKYIDKITVLSTLSKNLTNIKCFDSINILKLIKIHVYFTLKFLIVLYKCDFYYLKPNI